MSGFTQVGNKSKTVIFQHESHKLHIEFDASVAIKAGQPLTLVAATGAVAVWAKAALNQDIIGYALMDAASGDKVTVVMKAYMVILAISTAALNAVPVTYQGYDTTHPDTRDGFLGYSTYAVATGSTGVTEVHGWNLDPAAAAYGLIRVALH